MRISKMVPVVPPSYGQSQKLKNGQRKTSVTQLRKALKVVTLPNSQLIDLHIAHAYNVYNYVRMDYTQGKKASNHLEIIA